MSVALDGILAALALERLEGDRFRGESQDLGWGTVYGGQLIGQGLSAAIQTVAGERRAHALHIDFLEPGRVNQSVEYQVSRVRDGGSFSHRRVVGTQGGREIVHLSVSFQAPEEGFEHAAEAPEVARPQELISDIELLRRSAALLPKWYRPPQERDRAIEVKQVSPLHPIQPEVRAPVRHTWFRARGRLEGQPQWMHDVFLAWLTDFYFLVSSLLPHGKSWMSPGMRMASLNHSIWLHRPVNIERWHLHAVDSPTAVGGRGMVRGQIFDEAGVLIASTAQEGIIRYREPKAKAEPQC